MRQLQTKTSRTLLTASTLGLVLGACSAETVGRPAGNGSSSSSAALSDYNSLFEGVPGNSALPFDIKADGPPPREYAELVAEQSPVKSQGKRGVCSIFSTTALMEHLYIKAGEADPDFSEQYLQWSAKFEVGSFPDSSGSNANYNLQAISRFGIPVEDAWPFETTEWNEDDDPDCGEENENKPTRCYTNGEPPESALAAEKHFLPQGRWLNTQRESIIDHIRIQKTAVVVGLDFFYQAWNHRKSDLPRNLEAWDQGLVVYPNDEDVRISREKRAGHSILLVGWDLDATFPRRDQEGEVLLDAQGEPVMEQGFFIFKNSWGTDGFGVANPYGAGYGYISMRYVEEHGSARISSVPELGEEPAETELRTNDIVPIPDNDPAGVNSVLSSDAPGSVEIVSVDVEISHSYRGDLQVWLSHDGTDALLYDGESDPEGDAEGNLTLTQTLDDFASHERTGDWTLHIADRSAQDVGELRGWSLTLD